MIRWLGFSIASVALAMLAVGCGGGSGTVAATAGPTTTEPPPSTPVVVQDGTLEVRWTVAEATDPTECRLAGAATIHIMPVDASGQTVGDFAQDCTAFATTIDLPPGDYGGTAVLENASGGARSTTIDINPFTIASGATLVIDIDFPASSFYQ